MRILKASFLRRKFVIAFGHVFQAKDADNCIQGTGILGVLAVEEQFTAPLCVDLNNPDAERGSGMLGCSLPTGVRLRARRRFGIGRLDCGQG